MIYIIKQPIAQISLCNIYKGTDARFRKLQCFLLKYTWKLPIIWSFSFIVLPLKDSVPAQLRKEKTPDKVNNLTTQLRRNIKKSRHSRPVKTFDELFFWLIIRESAEVTEKPR